MQRPRIGISCCFETDTSHGSPRDRQYINAAYLDAVWAAGGNPLPLPILAQPGDADIRGLLPLMDGLLLTGGADLDPRLYGQPRHPQTQVMHARRSEFELPLFRAADASRLPTLAICLGFQVVHVGRGGQLIQHVDDLAAAPRITHHAPPDGPAAFHTVQIEPASRLAAAMGMTTPEVNSRHHQGVDVAHQGRGLRPVAFAPDGLLEGSEDCDGRFLLAVQWHPEDMIDRPEHLRLFEALVAAASAHPFS